MLRRTRSKEHEVAMWPQILQLMYRTVVRLLASTLVSAVSCGVLSRRMAVSQGLAEQPLHFTVTGVIRLSVVSKSKRLRSCALFPPRPSGSRVAFAMFVRE